MLKPRYTTRTLVVCTVYFAVAFGCVSNVFAPPRWAIAIKNACPSRAQDYVVDITSMAVLLAAVACIGAALGVLFPGKDGRGAIAALLASAVGLVVWIAYVGI